MAAFFLDEERPRRPREIEPRLLLRDVPEHKIPDYRLTRPLIQEVQYLYEVSPFFQKEMGRNDAIPAETEVRQDQKLFF
jgi:hypothetical protein